VGTAVECYPIVGLTGHRFLSASQTLVTRSELERLARKLQKDHETVAAISGMALGADTIWAETALSVGLELWSYIPFPTQADRWAERDRNHWVELRGRASRETVLEGNCDTRSFHPRDDAIVRDSDLVIAIYDRHRPGGTHSTMRKAIAAAKPLIVVDLVEGTTTLKLAPLLTSR